MGAQVRYKVAASGVTVQTVYLCPTIDHVEVEVGKGVKQLPGCLAFVDADFGTPEGLSGSREKLVDQGFGVILHLLLGLYLVCSRHENINWHHFQEGIGEKMEIHDEEVMEDPVRVTRVMDTFQLSVKVKELELRLQKVEALSLLPDVSKDQEDSDD